jgi:hypothetical protein
MWRRVAGMTLSTQFVGISEFQLIQSNKKLREFPEMQMRDVGH